MNEGKALARSRSKVALAVWRDLCVERKMPVFPVNTKALAEAIKIRVVEDDLGEDFQGMLLISSAGKAGILFNKNISPQGRINFTIAHEIGHFFLHRDRQEIRCSMADIEEMSEAPHGKEIEGEANTFASNLLMPRLEFSQDIYGEAPCLSVADMLSEKYGTSLTATACRMVELSPRPAAVMMMDEKKRCLWVYKNERLHSFYIKKGCAVGYGNGDDCENIFFDNKTWIVEMENREMKFFGKTICIIKAECTVMVIT